MNSSGFLATFILAFKIQRDMRYPIYPLLLAVLSVQVLHAQVDARLLSYPDVSATHITFSYGGDIWLVPRSGGTAVKLSSPDGPETFPRFSPDGQSIAFTGNYGGNQDVYVVPAFGGLPKRLTYHGQTDRVLDWQPDGQSILFASARASGRQRYNQLYTVSLSGGLPAKLPVPYGEFAAYSPDGSRLAYTPQSRQFRTWKRYRGGSAADIWLFDLESLESENITARSTNDELPMWHENTVYYLSDRGPAKRYNLWAYDLNAKTHRQLTTFSEFDLHWPAIGPDAIVFEAGGELYLYDLEAGRQKKVDVRVVTDQMSLAPRVEPVAKYMSHAHLAPDGKRAVVEARGELFSLPAEHGYVKNLTRSSGSAERYPAWSPNGRYIAFWSDAGGEYELTLMDLEKAGETQTLTELGPGFRYEIYWSPDSKKLAFVDQSMRIHIHNMETGRTLEVDKGLYWFEGGLRSFRASWSPDSRWLAYDRDLEHRANAVFLYDLEGEQSHQLTSGYYNCEDPEFDPDGKYLYFFTSQHFSPIYSDMDNSWIYTNSTQIAVVTLQKDSLSPLAPRNDQVTVDAAEAEKEEKSKKKKEKETELPEKEDRPIRIDLDELERRITLLPPEPGNYSGLRAVSGKVLYLKMPPTGAGGNGKATAYYFDLKEREEKVITEDINGYEVAARGEKLLIFKDDQLAILDIQADAKPDKMLPIGEMEMTVVPREEWQQIFRDAWRFERDYFYDPGMHGVDWEAMRERYGALVDDCMTRDDLNFVLGELIGELNASHTYRGGGDRNEDPLNREVGYLGIDWALADGKYQIQQIIRPAAWDAEVRSPLDAPGLDVREGDYILAVNGIPLDPAKEPYAAFDGLAGKIVELTINRHAEPDSARKVLVETLKSETRLRHLAWIEANRKSVEEATDGRCGYVYVRNTGRDGQSELVRQFTAQFKKDALIIDERWNSGGQIPDRFIELLDRKPLAYWAVRDGQNWQWPPVAHFGPKAMLINGWSGSGGDAFPDYFRKAGLGPLIGTRTWGGLIGISGSPSLIDGGRITVPTFRMYDPDGTWFREGHGVEPDIYVPENPTVLAKGTDPQLNRAIREIQSALADQPKAEMPQPPAVENRSK